jgi:hypothetical protein
VGWAKGEELRTPGRFYSVLLIAAIVVIAFIAFGKTLGGSNPNNGHPGSPGRFRASSAPSFSSHSGKTP